MTDTSATSAIERIARVLAARAISANADGTETSAAVDVDSAWRDHREDALAILRTLREPDAAIAPDDAAAWSRAVGAILNSV